MIETASGQSVFLYLPPQSDTAHAQFPGCFDTASLVSPHRLGNESGLRLFKGTYLLQRMRRLLCLVSRPCDFLRKAAHPDEILIADYKGALNNIFKLSHISGVIVAQEKLQSLIGYSEDLFSRPCVELLDECVDQQRDVFLPLGERRKLDLYHVEPVKEVFPEFPISYKS
jgi:hypothetical protein